MHEFDSQRGGEGDKDRVDHIEVKSSEKISQVTTGDTESRSTEGRHQSGSDGYTGDTFPFRRVLEATMPASPPKKAISTS